MKLPWLITLALAIPGLARADAVAPSEEKGADHRQKGDALPEELGGEVGIDPPKDAKVDLDLRFVDHDGREVTLREYLKGDLPVLLNLVYYRCPSMCGVILENQLESLKQLEWTPGKEFRVVTVSINPQEAPPLAKAKREAFLAALGRPEAAAGWAFLTGGQAPIQALAKSVGFGYRFDTRTREYAHAAGIFLLTPEGKLSRTLFGATYDPRTLRLSLVEAGQGKVGSIGDRIALFCYHFDAGTGRYTVQAMNLMRLAGLFTVTVLCAYLGVNHLRARIAAAKETR